MKLYNFKNRDKREVQLTEWDTDEMIFKRVLDQIKKDQVFIDVGAELDVLKETEFTLAEYKPTFMVEIHFGFGWKQNIFILLRSFGYELEIEKKLHKALVIAHA